MADPDTTVDRQYQVYVESVRLKNQAKMQQAIPRIRAAYDSGTAFFTKDDIREIMQQIEKAERGQLKKVSVTGLDGIVVQLSVNTGEVDPDTETPGVEMIYLRAHLEYYTVDHLTMIQDSISFQPRFAYLPLQITHVVEYRDATTKSPTPQCPYLPLEEVQENFHRERVEWEASKQCEELRLLLGSADIPPVQKIVAFACSTMTWDDEARHRSTVQHTLILTIRDCLAKRRQFSNPSTVKCFVQDPLYTSTDRQVLGDQGITVLDDPNGFLEIDEETIVLSHAPDIPVRQITADITRPAMMIWDKVKKELNSSPRAEISSGIRDLGLLADPISPRLEDMVREYVQLDFPKNPVNFCEDTTMYIRKPALVSDTGISLHP